MGKITINPGNLRKCQPGGEHITRIMYDDNEPPKNYIWGKPDGYLYVWTNTGWVKLNSIPNLPCGCGPGPEPPTDCISKKTLDARLKLLKDEIISYLTKLINMRNNSGSDGSAIAWVNENVIPILRALQSIDHSAFLTEHQSLDNYYTKSDITTNYYTKAEVDSKAINRAEFEQLASELGFVKMIDLTSDEYEALETIEPNVVYNITDAEASQYDDSVLVGRVSALETAVAALDAIDHSEFVTADQIGQSGVNFSGYVTNSDLETYVENAIADKADKSEIPSNVSDLTNDAGYLTQHQSLSAYSTTQQMNTAINTAVSDMATQTWVANNYEPKFTDLTNEVDPEAEAKTHASDNKVYITAVVEEGEDSGYDI